MRKVAPYLLVLCLSKGWCPGGVVHQAAKGGEARGSVWDLA